VNPRHQIAVVLCVAALLALAGWLAYGFGCERRAAGLARSDRLADRLRAIELFRGESTDLARQTLHRLTKDKEIRVALAAVRALAAVPDEESCRLLGDVCRGSPSGDVRGAAAAALGKYQNTPTDTLAQMLAADKDPAARAGAARGLSGKRDRAAADALVVALERDDDVRVRRSAMAALHSLLGVRFLYRPEAPLSERQQAIRVIKAEVSRIRAGRSGDGLPVHHQHDHRCPDGVGG